MILLTAMMLICLKIRLPDIFLISHCLKLIFNKNNQLIYIFQTIVTVIQTKKPPNSSEAFPHFTDKKMLRFDWVA